MSGEYKSIRDYSNLKYKYLVTVTSSKIDMYGNRYHFAEMVNVINGKSVKFHTDSDHNIFHSLNRFYGGVWTMPVYRINIDLPIREFNRASKDLPFIRHASTDEIKSLLESLEGEEV